MVSRQTLNLAWNIRDANHQVKPCTFPDGKNRARIELEFHLNAKNLIIALQWVQKTERDEEIINIAAVKPSKSNVRCT